MAVLAHDTSRQRGYRLLQTVSIAYISVPTVLFITGWIQPAYAIPFTLLTIAGIYLSIKAGWRYGSAQLPGPARASPTPDSVPSAITQAAGSTASSRATKRRAHRAKTATPVRHHSRLLAAIDKPVWFHTLTSLLVLGSALLAGVGGFAVQDGDYVKHNGFLLDLTTYSWPIAYEKTGPDDAPRVLNTYLGYYLPSAFVGKLLGFRFANLFSLLWVCCGLYLTLLWVSQFVRKRSVLYLILFVFFGELAYFGWAHYLPGIRMFGKNYNYANWMLFYSFRDTALSRMFWILGSNHTFLANGPHHIFPSWLCILMVLHDAVFRKTTDRSVLIFAFVPYVSAFMALGLAPFLLLAAIQTGVRKAITVQNCLVAPLLLLVAGLFLVSNPAQFEKGWIWDFMNGGDVLPALMRFFVLGFGAYFVIMHKKADSFHDRCMRPWLYLSVAVIVLFSFYRIGLYMDFPIKAYNPAWIIFQVCVIASISHSKTPVDMIRSALVILLLVFASIGAISNMKFAATSGLFKHPVTEQSAVHVNHIGPKDRSLALFSDGRSFFWRVLAKRPQYTKN